METFQVLVNAWPAGIVVPSGMVTSLIQTELSQPTAPPPNATVDVGSGIGVCCWRVGLGNKVKVAVGELKAGLGVAESIPACKVCICAFRVNAASV